MFNLYKNYVRKKALQDKELELIRREALEEEILIKRKEHIDKLNKLADSCAVQTAQYEHTFHCSREEKGIELAKLDGLIHANEEKLAYINQILSLKENELKDYNRDPVFADERHRLYVLIDKLIAKVM